MLQIWFFKAVRYNLSIQWIFNKVYNHKSIRMHKKAVYFKLFWMLLATVILGFIYLWDRQEYLLFYLESLFIMDFEEYQNAFYLKLNAYNIQSDQY